MLNVRDYSEGWKHQKHNTPNCPTTFSRHYLYVYLSFSALALQLVNQFGESTFYDSKSIVSKDFQLPNYHFLWIVHLSHQFHSTFYHDVVSSNCQLHFPSKHIRPVTFRSCSFHLLRIFQTMSTRHKTSRQKLGPSPQHRMPQQTTLKP
jgi:hypothetical protein